MGGVFQTPIGNTEQNTADTNRNNSTHHDMTRTKLKAKGMIPPPLLFYSLNLLSFHQMGNLKARLKGKESNNELKKEKVSPRKPPKEAKNSKSVSNLSLWVEVVP